VFILRNTGRRGAAARLSRRLHPIGVKMDRLDGHPVLKKWDIVAEKIARRGIRTASNDPS
jgi:hypothetical protein